MTIIDFGNNNLLRMIKTIDLIDELRVIIY
jgi:hypothetical protein